MKNEPGFFPENIFFHVSVYCTSMLHLLASFSSLLLTPALFFRKYTPLIEQDLTNVWNFWILQIFLSKWLSGRFFIPNVSIRIARIWPRNNSGNAYMGPIGGLWGGLGPPTSLHGLIGLLLAYVGSSISRPSASLWGLPPPHPQ